MVQTYSHNNIYANSFSPAFYGGSFVVRKSKNYYEKLKINRKLDLELTKEFYRVNQINVPNVIKKFSIKLENFFNLLTTPFISINEKDVYGVFNKKGEICGGFIGCQEMKRYQICGLFLDEAIKRKKETPEILKSILQNIKTLVENKKLKVITCDAYKNALSTIRLYKKAGFKPMSTNKTNYMYSTTISMYAKTNDLNVNIIKNNKV